MAETGHAERQRPHSMQSSNRSYSSTPDGSLGRRGELARPVDRVCGDGNRSDERGHVDDEVGDDGEVRHGLDGDPSRVPGRRGASRTRAPRGRSPGPRRSRTRRGSTNAGWRATGSRWILIHRSASRTVLVGLDLGLEGVEPRGASVAREPEDAEVAGDRQPTVPAADPPPRSRRRGSGRASPSRGEVGVVGQRARSPACDRVRRRRACDRPRRRRPPPSRGAWCPCRP